jgi:hypothetical protein
LTPAFVRDYSIAYRLGMAAVDLLLFALLLGLVPRLFPHESSREQTQRLLVYLACTVVLWHLLYDRLDLLLALLMMVALTLLVSRWHYAWSFAVLALGINFKLAPLVLAPVWILGSLPVDHTGTFFRPRTLVALAGRTLLLGGMVLACFLPFYLLAGERTLGFLAYHRGRGLEIGSVYSSVPLALQAVGLPVTLDYSYGSINVTSPVTPALTAAALAGRRLPVGGLGRSRDPLPAGDGAANGKAQSLSEALAPVLGERGWVRGPLDWESAPHFSPSPRSGARGQI